MSSDAEPDDDRLPPRRGLLLIVVAAVVLAADVLTKIAVVSALEGERPVRLLGGAVYLQLVRNPGAAFSMATGMTWVLTLIAVAVVCAIIWIMPKLRSVGWAIGLSLVLAGALGNLSDRFFRAPGPLRGHVVDFVSLFAPNGDVWPVFNVADSAIVVGGCLVVVMALLGREYDGRSTNALSKTGSSNAAESKAEEPS
jgi:signal peptidase II